MTRFVRPTLIALASAVLTILLVGGLHPAIAAPQETERPPESAPTAPPDAVVQAVVVGGTAFALMLGAALGVLLYTARRRRDEPL